MPPKTATDIVSARKSEASSTSDKGLKALKPADKPYKHACGKGMYLLVKPDGSKFWRFDYRFGSKRKTLAFGVFPTVGLAAANDRRDEARKLLAHGTDPGVEKKAEKAKVVAEQRAENETFKVVAAEWMAHVHRDMAPATIEKNEWVFREFLIPALGNLPITAITSGHIRDMLKAIDSSGKRETAMRAKVKAGQVFRWLIVEGRLDTDPTAALRGLIKKPKAKHHATITEPAAIGKLLRDLDSYDGHYITRAALQLAPLVFVRPGELRAAEWPEFDLDNAMWRIPGSRMKVKTKVAHLVPLSPRAVAILRELHTKTGGKRYVFPALRGTRCMSENTLNLALRALGYEGNQADGDAPAMTVHGFRAMASSRLNEEGFNRDAIERQLAHAESDKVREAYSHGAQFLDLRKRMMVWWGDYLHSLKTGEPMAQEENVVHLRRGAA